MRSTIIYGIVSNGIQPSLHIVNGTVRNADPEGPGRFSLMDISVIGISRLGINGAHTKVLNITLEQCLIANQ